MIRLNIIVPCYNPSKDWEKALIARFKAFQNHAAGLQAQISLIVVDDGSSRNNNPAAFQTIEQEIASAKVVHYTENRGKGFALRQGVAASDADFHLVTDIDFPYTQDSMLRIASVVMEKGGIAAGNRDTAYYDKVPAFRRWLSRSLRWLLRNIFHQPIDDSQCGLKAFDQAGRAVFLQTGIDRFLFDLEFLMLANGKVTITPVPVQLREGVVFSKVGWKILATEGRNFLFLLFRSWKKSIWP
ncbi:MAG: glycosyltransferase [Lewinellaceae bacterium]|nr:glycosyltransferase [Lewinellaceae bacterium]